jgi:transposase-like protein
MQLEEGERLRKKWEEMGNPPCNHPNIEKEYYLGYQTGDYICTTCGKTFWKSDIHKNHE